MSRRSPTRMEHTPSGKPDQSGERGAAGDATSGAIQRWCSEQPCLVQDHEPGEPRLSLQRSVVPRLGILQELLDVTCAVKNDHDCQWLACRRPRIGVDAPKLHRSCSKVLPRMAHLRATQEGHTPDRSRLARKTAAASVPVAINSLHGPTRLYESDDVSGCRREPSARTPGTVLALTWRGEAT